MASASPAKLPPLWFSRELFADYWTALISRVRQDDECDKVYSGVLPHPLSALQLSNQAQILGYNLSLVSDELLESNPFEPAEYLIASIKVAAAASHTDPPLANGWHRFLDVWIVFKRAQRKIYAISVATLRVGESMHYARNVPFGAGTFLLSEIHKDNRRNTTRSLFALLGSLFTLKAKTTETFEMFKRRFDLIISRFAGWRPPIILPEPLLLFFVMRGLSDDPYGPTKHIILAIENITLQRGIQLLRDVGQSEAGLITATLGSGPTSSTLSTSTISPVSPQASTTSVLALPPPPAATKPKLTREQRKTALCKRDGPCIHHGPRSLHATAECRDPQLIKRKKKKDASPPAAQQVLATIDNRRNTPVPQVAPQAAAFYPPLAAPTMPFYPPAVYHPMHPYMAQPPAPHPQANQHHSILLLHTSPYDADTESSDDDDDDADNLPLPSDYHSACNEYSDVFTIQAAEELAMLLQQMSDDDDDDFLPPLVDITSSSQESATESEHDYYFTSDSESETEVSPSGISHTIETNCVCASQQQLLSCTYAVQHQLPGKVFTHTANVHNPFHIQSISVPLLQATVEAYTQADSFRIPFSECTRSRTPSVPIHLIRGDDDGPPPPPPPLSSPPPSPSVSTEDEEGDAPNESSAVSQPVQPLSSTVDEFSGPSMLDDTIIAQLPDGIEKPQGSSSESAVSETLPYDPSLFVRTRANSKPQGESTEITLPASAAESSASVHKRRPRNYQWSQKGTKASRRNARSKRSKTDAKVYHTPPSSLVSRIPDMPPPLHHKPRLPECALETCGRTTAKKKYGPGYFRFCFHHRHLDSPASASHRSPTVAVASKSSGAAPTFTMPDESDITIEDMTTHDTTSSGASTQFPPLRRARAAYAYADGLHTILHYPQVFKVTLRGEPAVNNDWTVAPCMLAGQPPARKALKAVLHAVANRHVNPKSLCNHIGCIYNQGDLLTRRARHLAAVANIDRQLSKQPIPRDVCVLSSTRCRDVILDSGAGRHLHNVSSDFTCLRRCAPQKLMGFMGQGSTVSHSGTVRNFEDVLFMPCSQASVRSVGYALDKRGGTITFSTTSAVYHAPDGTPVTIASRSASGLYSVIQGAMPPVPPQGHPPVSVLISVPVQVRREAIHRFHQCLGHASIERMRYVMKNMPHVTGSLTTRDLALFTSCPACRIGKTKRAPSAATTSTRSTLFAHRLHADTTGIIRPSTSSGYRRALIVVDDASRWIFVKLLKAASKEECTRAMRAVLQEAAADAHVLRTQILRSDNGTEFINSDMQGLLAQGGIRHERTCVHTSHQNGVAERAIGKLMPMVRTMMAAASARPALWGEALHAAAHITNRMPSSANDNNHSPFQLRYARVPSITHFQPWGITAYVRRTAAQTKILQRADPGILVGYGHDLTHQKGWRVYLPSLRSVVTSLDVTFDVSLEESV